MEERCCVQLNVLITAGALTDGMYLEWVCSICILFRCICGLWYAMRWYSSARTILSHALTLNFVWLPTYDVRDKSSLNAFECIKRSRQRSAYVLYIADAFAICFQLGIFYENPIWAVWFWISTFNVVTSVSIILQKSLFYM